MTDSVAPVAARALRTAALRLAALLCAGLLCGGCISYPLDRLPPAGPLPAPQAPAKRPSVIWKFATVSGSDLGATSGDITTFGVGRLSDEFGGSLLRSGLFSTVEPVDGKRTADLQLDVVMTVTANDALIIASACLLFVVPTWRTVEFDLSAEARHADGRWERYHFTDAVRDVNWLPLILGMSFAPWGDAYAKVRANLVDTLLVHLAQDGFVVQAPGGHGEGTGGDQPPTPAG